jgi:hypothetical protein
MQWLNQGEWVERDMLTHVVDMRYTYKFWSECVKEGDHLGEKGTEA